MKKRSLLFAAAGVLAIIVVGYPAGAWFVGKQIETRFGDEYSALHDYAPMLTVADRKFERGLFSSRESVTLNLLPPNGQPPVRLLTMTSSIKHLPFPGIFALHVAEIDSDVKLDESLAPAVTGEQSLASIHSAFYFSGGGNVALTVPAFKSETLASDPATMTVTFSRGSAAYSVQGNAPRFAITDKSSANRVQISGVTISGEHQRVQTDGGVDMGPLYTGTDRLAIDQMEVSGPRMPADAMLIKHLTAEVATMQGKERDFVDIVEKIKADTLKIAGGDVAPAELDLTFRHLHAKTLADLSKVSWKLDPGKSEALMQTYVQALLTHDPEFSIDRLSFTRPEGETVLSALVKVQGALPGDFENPAALVGKSYASVDLKAPEQFVAGLSQAPFAPQMLRGGGFDNLMGKLLAVGYVTREGSSLKTRFEFHDAKPWLNGKVFSPQAMQ